MANFHYTEGCEVWQNHPHLEAVQASSLGRVRTKWEPINKGGKVGWCHQLGFRWRILRQRLRKNGYMHVCVLSKRFRVHVLVLEAFRGPRPLLDGKLAVARHLNDQRTDNQIENLVWGTDQENKLDAKRNGVFPQGEEQYQAALTDAQATEVRRLYETGNFLQVDLARRFGVSRVVIHGVVHNITYKHLPLCRQDSRKVTSERSRNPRGSNCRKAKLTEESVELIRKLYATGEWLQYKLAEKFEVSRMTINLIVHQKIWRHVL